MFFNIIHYLKYNAAKLYKTATSRQKNSVNPWPQDYSTAPKSIAITSSPSREEIEAAEPHLAPFKYAYVYIRPLFRRSATADLAFAVANRFWTTPRASFASSSLSHANSIERGEEELNGRWWDTNISEEAFFRAWQGFRSDYYVFRIRGVVGVGDRVSWDSKASVCAWWLQLEGIRNTLWFCICTVICWLCVVFEMQI